MLTDSICDIIHSLVEEYHHYNNEPFNYSKHYRPQVEKILFDMYMLIYDIDGTKNIFPELYKERIKLIIKKKLDSVENEDKERQFYNMDTD